MKSTNTFRMLSPLARCLFPVRTVKGHLKCRPDGPVAHIENTWHEHIVNVCHVSPPGHIVIAT